MRSTTTVAAGLALTLTLGLAAPVRAADEARKPVDLVIALDTSSSMDGLIDAARRKVWDVVNELAKAKPLPRLRVALLAYGSPEFGVETGYVKIVTPFTEDLDALYLKLFSLKTNGGDEFVGRVVRTSLEKLDWSGKDALKLIFVCGNESADQDREANFKEVARSAVTKGAQVNAIYCGGAGDADAAGWRELAAMGEGVFGSIDQGKTIDVKTPFDEALAALGRDLNGTYLAYGAHGEEGAKNQAVQDSNAGSLGSGTMAGRSQCKAGELYRCAWDLVDACRDGKVDLEKAKPEELPEALRKMTPAERKAYVEDLLAKRKKIQEQINTTNVKREAFVAEELKKAGHDAETSFDTQVKKALRSQAERKGFGF